MSVTEKLRGAKLIAVTAAKTSRQKTQRKTVTLGSVRVHIAAGQNKTVPVSLSQTGRHLLSRHHPLRVKLSVLQEGSTAASRTITFKTNTKSPGGGHKQ